jgi:hypothetical protein
MTYNIAIKSVGMETDGRKESWGDAIDNELATQNDPATPLFADKEGVVMKDDYWGPAGLVQLLITLGVTSSSLEQYSDCIENPKRNKQCRGIVESVKTNLDESKAKDAVDYWVVFDDISISVFQTGDVWQPDRYVKHYGNFENLMCDKDVSTRHTVLDKDSKMFKQCEKIGRSELDRVLPFIRSRRSRQGSIGYGGDSGYDYDEGRGQSVSDGHGGAYGSRYGSRYGGYNRGFGLNYRKYQK